MSFLFPPTKRQYITYALQCVRNNQNDSLPSCEKLIERILVENLTKTDTSSIRIHTQRKAMMAVYNIALNAVDSPNYRNVFGMLNATGEQFLYICRSLLEYFASVGYVSKCEYTDHLNFLIDCDLNFERYGLYP